MTALEATIGAFIESGQRVRGKESITAETPLSDITFGKDGDRSLAGVEFLAAFEQCFCDEAMPNRVATPLVNAIDKGRGTVGDVAARIERWVNAPPRKRTARGRKVPKGQMELEFA